MASSAMSPAALATSAVTFEATFHSHRVQHAALETHGGLAWLDDAGVLNVRTSTQVPFLTRRALVGHLPASHGQGPRVLRARRRRLWRQAGDVRRGYSGARRAEDRTAGQARAHPRGAVHRDVDAAPDAGPHQGRCRCRRQAHRAAARRALQHRRLRQSRRLRDVPRGDRSPSPSTTARTSGSTASSSTPTRCRPARFAAMACRRP